MYVCVYTHTYISFAFIIGYTLELGWSSVLRKVEADVVASAFNVPADYAQRFLGRQAQAVIVPGVLLHVEEPGERMQNRSTNNN